jgi:Ca2+-binding RTX toxin-like protein
LQTVSTVRPHSLILQNGNIENVYASRGDYIDTLTGNDLANILLGREGNDKLRGLGGNDRLEGGDGNDNELFGGDGNDIINGGHGMDTIHGGAGDDVVQGDGFSDRIELLRLKNPTGTAEQLNEASGLIVSRANENILFTIEDANQPFSPTAMFANDKTSGESRGFFNIGIPGNPAQAAQNVDWEDLAFYKTRTRTSASFTSPT